MNQQQEIPQQPFTSIPWLLITETDVRSSQTQRPIFRIDKSAAPGSKSKKSLLTLGRSDTGVILGTVRFRSMESYMELSVNSQTAKIKEDGLISFRYYFQPTFASDSKWYWADNDDGGLKLSDGKKGSTIASVNSNILVVEQSNGLTEAAVDEIVLTAVAMMEKKRRRKKSDKLEEGIGEIVGAVTGF